MPGGWGRRAAVRIDRTQFGEDELLKSLEANVGFSDYAQWQRTGLEALQSQSRKTDPLTPILDRPPFIVGAGSPFKRIGSATSSCRHGNKKEPVYDTEEEKKKAEGLKILQLRIRARRQTLEEYHNRHSRLLVENMKLKNEIATEESGAHDLVKKQLRKYEKFRSGIATIHSRYVKELTEAVASLEEAKKTTEKELNELQLQVEEVDGKLKEKQDELHILMNYKDKEYPVKAIRIADLENEIDNLKISNEDDQQELEHIIATEKGKFENERLDLKKEITEKVTEEAIRKMHPSLKETALHNMVMKKEMEFHENEVKELQKKITALEEENKKLLEDPKTNIKMQLFPEFYPNREKCTPDMDVILDIPTQEWLPI